MGCNSCGSSPKSYTYYTPSNCKTHPDQMDAGKVIYTGPALGCIGVSPNTSLDTVLSQINSTVCQSISYDWSSFNYGCLPTYTNPKEFAEGISAAYCTLDGTVGTFIGTTFPAYQSVVNSRFAALEVPAVESDCIIDGIEIKDTDTTQVVQQKLSDITCYLASLLDVSSANWNTCYTVTPVPNTPVEGFNALITQICALKTTVDGWTGLLPTFNNIGTCLPTPSATESLYSTVIKIRDKVCAAATYDPDNITWGNCVVNPTPITGTSLEDTITYLVGKIEAAFVNRITGVSSDFAITQTSPGDPCSGLTLSLNASIVNNKVALDSSDGNPDYLLDKIVAGTGVTFDTTTTTGKVIINTTVHQDQYVKVSSNDTTAGYLASKITGNSSGPITTTATVTGSGNEVLTISASMDPDQVASDVLDAVLLDSVLQAKFCAAAALCSGTSTSTTSAFYVSDRQTGTGDGSNANPFKTIDEAFAAVVGNGTPSNPQYPNSTIYVFKGTYSTSINGYIRGITYYFEDGTELNYIGTDYFIDYVQGVNYNNFDTPIYIVGNMRFSSFTGGLLRIVANSIPSDSWDRAYVSLYSAYSNVGDSSNPLTKPLIHVEVTSPTLSWGRPTVGLRLEAVAETNGQTLVYAKNGPRIYMEGGSEGQMRLNVGSGLTNAIRWEYPRSVGTNWSHTGFLHISNIMFSGGGVPELVHIAGMTGQCIIENPSFINVASGSSTNRFLYLDDHQGVGLNGSMTNPNPLIIKGLYIPKDVNFTQYNSVIGGTRTLPMYNNIHLSYCHFGVYDVDQTVLNVHILEGGVSVRAGDILLETQANGAGTVVVKGNLEISQKIVSPGTVNTTVTGALLGINTSDGLIGINALSGTYYGTGDSTTYDYVVTHNLGVVPSAVHITPCSANAVAIGSFPSVLLPYYVSNITSNTFTISYIDTAPSGGPNSVVFSWTVIA